MNQFKMLLVLPILISCSKGGRQNTPLIDLSTALKDNIESFKLVSEVRAFNRGNLWEFIDGAAEQFLKYGYTQAATADYRSENFNLTTTIYGFSTPAGASGYYVNFKASEKDSVPVGAEGFIAPGVLAFYKDKWFVQIDYFDQDVPRELLIRFGRGIDQVLATS